MVTKDTGDPDTTAQLNTWWDEYVAVADNLRTTAEGHVAVVAQVRAPTRSLTSSARLCTVTAPVAAGSVGFDPSQQLADGPDISSY